MSETISDKGIEWLRNEIETLRTEKKALKETLDKTTDLVVDYQERLVKVQQSRDELLNALKYIYKCIDVNFCGLPDGTVEETIQKAQELKDKE